MKKSCLSCYSNYYIDKYDYDYDDTTCESCTSSCNFLIKKN